MSKFWDKLRRRKKKSDQEGELDNYSSLRMPPMSSTSSRTRSRASAPLPVSSRGPRSITTQVATINLATSYTESKRKTGEDEDEGVMENKSWYHGMLPRDDINQLLQKDGDFVVRISEVKNKRQIVISTRWKKETKHFVVRKTRQNHFYVEKHIFESVPDLIRYHTARKEPLTSSSGVLLLRAIPKQSWEIHHEQITLGCKLGEGAFGDVYKATLLWYHKRQPVEVAVKTCRAKQIPQSDKLKFMREARLMRQYSHPNIVRLLGVAAQQEPLMLIMELVPGGSLLSYVRKQGTLLTTREKIRLCLDTSKGMEYLENKACIHRDLAARNCLLGTKNEVKISDFGLSQNTVCYKMKDTKKLPIKWLAPETLTTGLYSSKTDCWSFGILIWEVVTGGKEPYPKMTNLQVQKQVPKGYRMELPLDTPHKLTDLVKKCWNASPDDRPTFSNAKSDLEKMK